jgi:hypothetical protein
LLVIEPLRKKYSKIEHFIETTPTGAQQIRTRLDIKTPFISV